MIFLRALDCWRFLPEVLVEVGLYVFEFLRGELFGLAEPPALLLLLLLPDESLLLPLLQVLRHALREVLHLHLLQHLLQSLQVALAQVAAPPVVVLREDPPEEVLVGFYLFCRQLLPVLLLHSPGVPLQAFGHGDDLLQLGVGDLQSQRPEVDLQVDLRLCELLAGLPLQ